MKSATSIEQDKQADAHGPTEWPVRPGTSRPARGEERWPLEPMVELAGRLRELTSWTWLHSGRVARYAVAFGKKLKLSRQDMMALQCAALLHDIGKIAIPAELLDKSSKLTIDEWYTITKHSMASSLLMQAHEVPARIAAIARSHHEWYDGKGYPLGLEGDEIPLGARVLSLADAFDAMRSNRPYRAALSPAGIVEEIEKGAGSQFDPVLVEMLLPLIMGDALAAIPKRVLRIISDDPMLCRQLWFASYPLGWEMEVWPPAWAAECPPELLLPGRVAGMEEHPNLTVIDGRCVHRAPEGAMDNLPQRAVWIDPVSDRETCIYRPLDLAQLLEHVEYFDEPKANAEPATSAAIRVLIADPYQLFRQALRRCLAERPEVEVVAEVESPAEYRKARAGLDYDVAVVASDLLSGTRSTAPLHADDYHLDDDDTGRAETAGVRRPTIVLVTDEDMDNIPRGHSSPPIYVPRSAPSEILVEAIRAAHDQSSGKARGG